MVMTSGLRVLVRVLARVLARAGHGCVAREHQHDFWCAFKLLFAVNVLLVTISAVTPSFLLSLMLAMFMSEYNPHLQMVDDGG